MKCFAPKDAEWKILSQFLLDLELSSDITTKIQGIIRSRDLEKLFLALHDFNPRRILEASGTFHERDAQEFFKKYQLGSFLKKYPFKGTDTRTPAIESFERAEYICSLFNSENYKGLVGLSETFPPFLGIIEELRKDIRYCLGDVPNDDCIRDHAMHGPGVSLGDSYNEGQSTSYFKYSNLPYSVTRAALPLARHTIESDQRWLGALDNWYRLEKFIPFTQPKNLEDFWNWVFEVVDGSRITVVPKNINTDRTIAIEPLMNVYLQLGLDRILRKRIRRRWGYNLNSQEKNQELAELGSKVDDYSTLDLSMASDTISLKIVELLLPAEWYNLLIDLRSPTGELEGQKVSFSKLSSMGNGYTFAIETLIFGAIARCAIRRTNSERKSAVFGDDIIVPRQACKFCIDLLIACGFSINDDKSFISGPFRESCGQDFYLGVPVRPIFLKRRLSNTQSLIYLFNSLVLLEERLPWEWGLDFSKTRSLLFRWIPKSISKQFYGPISDSLDTHLFLDRPLQKRRIGNYVYKSYYKLAARPIVFNRWREFFFTKLMNQLRGEHFERRKNFWDRERISEDSGNAFNVVKRGFVQIICTRCTLPEGSSDPGYLKP